MHIFTRIVQITDNGKLVSNVDHIRSSPVITFTIEYIIYIFTSIQTMGG